MRKNLVSSAPAVFLCVHEVLSVNKMRLSFELDFEAYLKTMQNLVCFAAGPRVVKTISTEGLECLQNPVHCVSMETKCWSVVYGLYSSAKKWLAFTKVIHRRRYSVICLKRTVQDTLYWLN